MSGEIALSFCHHNSVSCCQESQGKSFEKKCGHRHTKSWKIKIFFEGHGKVLILTQIHIKILLWTVWI